MSHIEDRLTEKGLQLPTPAAPVASYVPTRIEEKTLYISGQLSMKDGAVVTGILGESMSLEEGMTAAELCGLMLLAQAKLAVEGDLDRIAGCIRLGGFVASTPTFTDHPKVINGASDLMQLALGDAGKHTRAAVGVSALPLGAAVEVDGIFALH